MENQGPSIGFFSVQDLILNEKSHVALHWQAAEETLELEVFAPARVNNSAGAFLSVGTITFSGRGAKQWVQAMVESKGRVDVHMHITGIPESEPKARPLTIAKEDSLRLSYDANGRNMTVEVWGKGPDSSEAKRGSISIPLSSLVEFLGQVMAYEKQLGAALEQAAK